MSNGAILAVIVWSLLGMLIGGGLIANNIKQITTAQLVFAVLLSGVIIWGIGVIVFIVVGVMWIWELLGKVGKKG